MNIHEYQAKAVLREFGVPVPRGIAAMSVDEAVKAANDLGGPVWVVKAQIHAGGRGKAGGVKVVKSVDDVKREAERLQAFHSAVAAALDTYLPQEHVAVAGITRDRESPHRRSELVGDRGELDTQQQRLRPGVQCSHLAMPEVAREENASHGR